MKDFTCTCGQRIFFDNTECLSCGRLLRFDPQRQEMVTLIREADGVLVSASGERFHDCRNHIEYQSCNWVLPAGDRHRYCRSCRLNKIVPHLERPGNVQQWAKLEAAKRHLIYTLMQLGLPVQGRHEAPKIGLQFAFLEDSRSNANVRESYVATGHAMGLITLNLAEADDAYRERIRQQLGEYYRTILGHFRHESGHYYYDLLVRGTAREQEVIEVFGNPHVDYQQALKSHYRQGGNPNWQGTHISAYACSHPLEDWAETWAHYLHMWDTLDTARAFGAAPVVATDSVDELVKSWVELTVVLNALNRSMGLPDAYPFVLTDSVIAKLRVIHRVIAAANQ